MEVFRGLYEAAKATDAGNNRPTFQKQQPLHRRQNLALYARDLGALSERWHRQLYYLLIYCPRWRINEPHVPAETSVAGVELIFFQLVGKLRTQPSFLRH